MHDGMQYDPITGQGHDSRALKAEIRPFSKAISSPISMGLANDHALLH